MYCSNCGNKIEDGARFCGNCGNAVAVSQPETNPSVMVSGKSNKKAVAMAIIAVCIAFVIIAVILGLTLHKKVNKVTKIIDAYEKTIDADSFNIHVITNNFRYVYEVFGKGGLENTYIARYHIRGDFDDVKSDYEDYLDEAAHGDETCGYEYELLANRDFEGLWDAFFAEETGLKYDDAYKVAVDMASDYLKNKGRNGNIDVAIEDNRYSISMDFDELEQVLENSGHADDAEDFLEEAEELEEIGIYEGFRFEVTLGEKYIESLYAYLITDIDDDLDDERVIMGIEFDHVNELTKKTSLAYKLYNESKEEANSDDTHAEEAAVAEEAVDGEASMAESDFSSDVEVKFNCFAYWVDNIEYSNNVLHLYQNPGEGNAQFDISYDIDENCKWIKANEEGEEDWGIEGNDAAAQKLVDAVTYSNAMYEKCVQAGNSDYADVNYPYRDEVCYTLILNGYSTSENSATITEVALLHNDVRFDYGYDNKYVHRY